MNKDDDVETDDSLVTGTQKSVLRNLKEAIKQYEMLKDQGENEYRKQLSKLKT